MIDYRIEESTGEEYKYVVWRVNEKDNGSCCRSIFHSNDESECKKFISKQRRKDSYRAKKLTKQMDGISERKHILSEEYKKRIKYVKKYNKKEPYYD